MFDQGKLDPQLIEMATRFIYMGLESRRDLSGSLEYKQLLRNYKNNSIFRMVVKAIANGLSLEILSADYAGVFISPKSNSVFATRLSSAVRTWNPSEDKFIGLVLIALAAFYFPKSTSFDESTFFTSPITIHELEAFIREKTTQIKEKQQPAHIEAGKDQLELLMTSYLQLPNERHVDSKKRSTREHFIRKTLNFLIKQRLFIKKDNEYWPTPKFRVQMESMSENDQIKSFLGVNDMRGGF